MSDGKKDTNTKEYKKGEEARTHIDETVTGDRLNAGSASAPDGRRQPEYLGFARDPPGGADANDSTTAGKSILRRRRRLLPVDLMARSSDEEAFDRLLVFYSLRGRRFPSERKLAQSIQHNTQSGALTKRAEIIYRTQHAYILSADPNKPRVRER